MDTVFELFVDILHAMPWVRRILLLAILAASLWFGIMGVNGFSIWAVVFFGFELASYLFQSKHKI